MYERICTQTEDGNIIRVCSTGIIWYFLIMYFFYMSNRGRFTLIIHAFVSIINKISLYFPNNVK